MAAANQPVSLDVISGRTGNPLKQHNYPCGTFVVSEPGSAFTLILRNNTSARSSVRVEIDGSFVGTNKQVGANTTANVYGWAIDRGRKSEFTFASPPTHDDSNPQAVASAADLAKLCTIRAIFMPVKYRGKPKHSASSWKNAGAPQQLSVPEGKKAMALGVTAGQGAAFNKPHHGSSWTTDHSKPPLATITLRYCVPDALCLSSDPALKAVGEALAAVQPPPAAGGASSSSSGLAAAAAPQAGPQASSDGASGKRGKRPLGADAPRLNQAPALPGVKPEHGGLLLPPGKAKGVESIDLVKAEPVFVDLCDSD